MAMPVLDGREATKRIRTATPPGGRRTVIIALTASAFEEERETVLAAGCDDFVTKPFEEHVIFEKMALHLGIRYHRAEEEAPAPTPFAPTPEDPRRARSLARLRPARGGGAARPRADAGRHRTDPRLGSRFGGRPGRARAQVRFRPAAGAHLRSLTGRGTPGRTPVACERARTKPAIHESSSRDIVGASHEKRARPTYDRRMACEHAARSRGGGWHERCSRVSLMNVGIIGGGAAEVRSVRRVGGARHVRVVDRVEGSESQHTTHDRR